MKTHSLLIRDLLQQPDYPYARCAKAMRQFTQLRNNQTCDEIWLLQHTPVYTLGKAGLLKHLRTDPKNIPIIRSDRGGQITYHGPGQWMIYTLLDLHRLKLGIKSLVQTLEQVLINLCAQYDIIATRRAGAPGIYYQQQKLGAIGLRVSQGRCYHGLACNLNLDLAAFAAIDPCGYQDLSATSWQEICLQQKKPFPFNQTWIKQWKQNLSNQLQWAFHYQEIITTSQLPAALNQQPDCLPNTLNQHPTGLCHEL